MSVLEKNNNNGKIYRFDVISNDVELVKRSEKSKIQKLSKSQKTPKSKKLWKSENLPKFDTKNAKPSFLFSSTSKVFNCLWLAFIKAPILDVMI